jgi:CHAD domain-containing protein
LWKEYGKVRAHQDRLQEESLEELHALRIEIKRLRYTLEFFSETLDAHRKISDILIEPLVALQDHLGQIQDAVVTGQELTDFITAEAKSAKRTGGASPEFQAIAAYHSEMQTRITNLRASLPAKWQVVMDASYRRQFGIATASV